MKSRFLAALLVAAAALTLSGCIQMHSATTIEKDGSGTASFRLSFSQGVSDALKEMQGMDMDMGGDMEMPDFSKVDKAELEKAGKEHGVKITRFSRDPVDGRETLDIEMSFEDLKGLSFMMNKVMGESSDNGGFGIFDNGDGNFILRSATYEYPDQPAEEAEEAVESETTMPEMDPEMMGKQMELMGKLMASMSELSVHMEITVPGDIVKSNAPTVEGRTSIWTVDSSNMMSMQGESDMEPEIVFSAKGLKIKPQTE
ncbi:MAG: hypothetical protein AB7V45_06045 [Candidatus Krumholzibacteriia bacterium]